MENFLRLFFAIEINNNICDSLVKLMAELQQNSWGKHIHWTLPENLHITLRFIGPCQNEQVPNLVNHVKEAIHVIKPFTLHLSNICLFPTKRKPHVLAINIAPAPALLQLANIIEQSTIAAGFVPEQRPYLPHLTLGRLTHRNLNHFHPQFPAININFMVNKIVLLNSEIINKQRIYKPVVQFNLCHLDR